MIEDIKPLIGKLTVFARQRMGFERPPKLFLRKDSENSKKLLGKTAHYDPEQESVTLFVTSRHPKDILRSLAHELVHHSQNLRGEFSTNVSTEPGYAQKDNHMRDMEKEAYLSGNMCFRDWEDSLDDKDIYVMKLAESKFLKENKTMTIKITKEFLKETIRKVLAEQNEIQDAIKDLQGAPELQGTDTETKEGGCGKCGTPECTCEDPKNEELEEAEGHPLDVAPPFKGKPGPEDFEKLRAGAKPRNKNESKIQTPEQENTLYEQRFAPKNNRLFEKLVKEWTK